MAFSAVRRKRARETLARLMCNVDNVSDLRSESLSTLLFDQQSWQFRKVQSHQLQDGNYSVVRVSIDCVPQNLPGLEYRAATGSEEAQGSFLLPVTYMDKGALRQFDMTGLNGEPLPVVGRSEYTGLMVETITYQIEEAILPSADSRLVRDALQTVLDGDPDEAQNVCRELVEDGTSDGLPVLDPSKIRDFARELLTSLASMYVLFVLVPRDYAKRRVVIKYSHHAQQALDDLPVNRRWLGAAGLDRLPISFELSHPTGSASHHLEVSVPPDLTCSALRMPGSVRDRNTDDSSEGGVVHSSGAFTVDPGDPAVAEFGVPWEGMRATTWFVSLLTFVILYLGLVLPGAQEALLDASDGAGGLLLAVPAVVIAFAAGRRESAIEAVLLGPLRYCVLVNALWLLACAGSIVGVLHDPWRGILWITGALVSGGFSLLLCAAELQLRLGRHRWFAATGAVTCVLLGVLGLALTTW